MPHYISLGWNLYTFKYVYLMIGCYLEWDVPHLELQLCWPALPGLEQGWLAQRWARAHPGQWFPPCCSPGQYLRLAYCMPHTQAGMPAALFSLTRPFVPGCLQFSASWCLRSWTGPSLSSTPPCPRRSSLSFNITTTLQATALMISEATCCSLQKKVGYTKYSV